LLIENESFYLNYFFLNFLLFRAFDELYALGAEFDPSVELSYTRINLISDEPVFLGNYTEIMTGTNKTLKENVLSFYSSFQVTKHILEQIKDIYDLIILKEEFYFYYNQKYWYLHLKKPFITISYENIPLPGTS
jgi:ceroid-lipofuscinosis neuronal protein 5